MMKIVTRNLITYATLLLAYTLLFRFGLSSLLTAEKWIWVKVIAVIYGAMIFVTAWMTGRRDGKENFLFDAGFRWNLTTGIVWGLVSEGWFLLGLHSNYESIRMIHIPLLIWSGFLVLHFSLFLILKRRTIGGVHKTDIFE
ncbi:MAG: hypothetical protein KAR19_06335 [Bacteroidales bacterium]|nr:hypothetical protein [Bacteroidales bacterium]